METIGFRSTARTLICSAIVAVFAMAQEPTESKPAEDLADASLEQLMNVEISSVSKRAERLLDAPAAVFVITAEDIRRSGARNLAEALRMAPGVSVAQINSHEWAITARGFNGQFANKLLVLIDGRAVYTPTFAGVYWDAQDVPLFDVDRIEVIRGPGATLWGANAVNGVINVITKHSADTQGGQVHASVGTEQIGSGTVRYGGRFGDDLTWRVYGKGQGYDDTDLPGVGDNSDAWERYQSGARFDWRASEIDRLTFNADSYLGRTDQSYFAADPSPPFFAAFIEETAHFSGWNVGGSWTRDVDHDESLTLGIYYDATRRTSALLEDQRDTIDVDFQHRFRLGSAHEITWGVGYRLLFDDFATSYVIDLRPKSRNDQLFSAFVQDQIALVDKELKLTVGSKFEHNDYSGFEVQPSVRIAWSVDEDTTLWGSVSRAVRSPSRADHDLLLRTPSFIDPMLGVVTPAFAGSRNFESEVLTAFELGFRTRPAEGLQVDLALFYNDYDRLTSNELGAPFPDFSFAPPHFILPFVFDNRTKGEAYGFELVADWRATQDLRFVGSYSLFDLQLHAPTSGDPIQAESPEGASPEQQFSLRSQWSFAEDWDFDVAAYWVDDLGSGVDSYLRLDARLAWRPTDGFEAAIGVQNLLDSRHLEAPNNGLSIPVEIERAAYVEVFFRF
jgi:iron complex outermembrane recepter protein